MYKKGIVCTAVSAVLFGVIPALTKALYSEGFSALTVCGLRGLSAMIVLAVLLPLRGIPIKLNRSEIVPVSLCGVIGIAVTTILLYISYFYIPSGLATTLHFSYPLLTNLAAILVFHEKPEKIRLAALLLGTLGIVLSVGREAAPAAATGYLLALASGLTYSFFIIYVDKSGLKDMNTLKLSFYLSVFMGVVPLLCEAGLTGLHITLTAKGLALILAQGILISVVAQSLFQLGVRYTGASTASILSTLEPITSILLGMFLFYEKMTAAKYAGCALVLAGVALVAFKRPVSGESSEESSNEESSEESRQGPSN